MKFSIEADNQIIAEGGFFCLGCLTGQPAAARSSDPRYCYSCHSRIMVERKIEESNRANRDTWTHDGYYITFGKKYGVRRDGQSYCAGAVVEVPQDGVKPLQETRQVVSKPVTSEIIPPATSSEVMKQVNRGGRPPKTAGEKVSRVTAWRREQKEKQLKMAGIE